MASDRHRHPNHRPAATLPPELRRTTVPPHVRAWIERETGAAITGVRRLPGASSTAVHRLHLDGGGRLVLRRYVWSGFREAEPDAPAREVDCLRFAHRHGLAVPEVIAADSTGRDVGDGIPVLVMSNLGGRALAEPDLGHLAEVAASIHAVDADDLGHEYFPWYEAEMTTPPPRSARPELWERAIAIWRDELPAYHPTLIHRDFHPGNVLWSRGRLAGVVDWASACRGPVGCDLAHCRANLRGWAGPDAAERFLTEYEAVTGTALDPFWVMANLLEHDYTRWSGERLAGIEPDLAAVLAAVTG